MWMMERALGVSLSKKRIEKYTLKGGRKGGGGHPFEATSPLFPLSWLKKILWYPNSNTHTNWHTHGVYMQCTSLRVSFFYAFTHTQMWVGVQSASLHTHFSYTLILSTTHPVSSSSRGILSLTLTHTLFHTHTLSLYKAGIYVFWCVHYLQLGGTNMNIKRRVRAIADRTTH